MADDLYGGPCTYAMAAGAAPGCLLDQPISVALVTHGASGL